MEYILMHKNIPVAEVEIDSLTGSILKVANVENPKHLPFGIVCKKGIVDRAALNEWWKDRSIPASRSGVNAALEVLKLSSTQALLTKCFGLSLSDQYWMKPAESTIIWENINFFDNSFSEDIGDVLLGKVKHSRIFNFNSPDNTSDGCLKKRWKIVDSKRCLVKGGSAPFMQQPFNEVIASKLMDALNIPHVDYSLIWDDGLPYSVCEDFITRDTELISAWRIMQSFKKDNNTSVYQHYINCCNELGIKNIEIAIDQMIVVDFLLANEDRHQNNFGLIRNADTLQWIGVAPIFDSGSALGYDKLPSQILREKFIDCKPFKKSHKEQLKLVKSFKWINFDAIKNFDKEIRKVLSEAGEYANRNRINLIANAFTMRYDYLYDLAMSVVHSQDNIEEDIEEDIAEDYTNSITML
ncbi:MAG: excisionase [Clostridiales bacterium]|nr:excisionase [Clostridiales bacterium]